MKTRNGIYNNLLDSTYKVNTGDIVFVFSSEFYKGKFIDLQKENREKLRRSLHNRFLIDCVFNDYFDIILYKKIEKRGFLIYSRGEMFTCPNQVKCVGVKKIEKNYQI